MAWIAFNHPSRKRLLAWLDHSDAEEAGLGEHEAQSITDHVDDCERCAAKLEELAGSPGDVEIVPEMGAALESVFEPPVGIHERVMKKIDERKRADRELSLLFGIFAIPTDAADLMMPELPGDSDSGRGRQREDEE